MQNSYYYYSAGKKCTDHMAEMNLKSRLHEKNQTPEATCHVLP